MLSKRLAAYFLAVLALVALPVLATHMAASDAAAIHVLRIVNTPAARSLPGGIGCCKGGG